ncbi:MAG: hypothetical protein JXQ73_29660 [Phycisphaerae bacterium]|nr:hypothetical protein [Phycisphaerae bacterium]
MCHHQSCSCGGGGLSRRELLLTAAGAGVVGGYVLREATAAEASEPIDAEPREKWPDVRVAFLRPKDKYWLGWPGTAWDVGACQEYMKKGKALIAKFGEELKVRVDIEPEPLYDEAAVNAFLAKIKQTKPGGVILMPLHMNQWASVNKLAGSGRPTIIFAPLGTCFTGHIQQVSKQPGVYLASSADFELNPIRYGMKMIRTEHDVRRSRIAVLRGSETKDQVLEPFGLKLRYLPRARFPEAFKKIDAKDPKVVAMADDYQKRAAKIVEPKREDIINASRNYYACLDIMKAEQCNGFTMDCLGLVMAREIPCPPCMAYAKLLDVGIPGVCEADINAVMSHMLCCKLLDRPGFQQDPVPETVHNTFIGAHCVCGTKLNGYDKPSEKFILRSHSESDIGVSLQVIWRPEQEVTVMQFAGPGKMMLGKGKVLRNFDTPPAGGCRTSVELAIDGPVDTRDTKGFHQLFIYGDHVRDFQAYGQMFGIATEHV